MKSTKGYTLTEMLVVTLIISILAVVTGASFLRWLDRIALNNANREIYQQLGTAKLRATSTLSTYQLSIMGTPPNGQVRYCIHPASTPVHTVFNTPACKFLDPNIRLDVETTLYKQPGDVYRIQFGYKGYTNGQLGKIVLATKNHRRMKVCSYVSTLLGATRMGKQRGLTCS